MKFLFLFFALTFYSHSYGDISRPGDKTHATKVATSIFILDLDAVDTAQQQFEANILFLFRWHDPRLSHNQETIVRKPLQEVWHPRLQSINQQKLWSTFPEVVEIQTDGTVTYTQRVWGSFSQPLVLEDFPFDTQTFNIDVVAARFKPSEVLMVQNSKFPSGLSKELSVPDWEIISSNAATKNYQLTANTKIISGFQLSFIAKRRMDYYIINIIIPLLLIVAMSWVIFWIDPKESSTQISVAITSMLTLIAYRFAIGSNLPQLSYLTRLDLFILLSTLLVFASLIEAVITTTLAHSHRYELALKIDFWCRAIFPLSLLLVALKSFSPALNSIF